MILLLLLASISWAQSSGTAKSSFAIDFKVSNLGKDVRELQRGRPVITGLPKFQGGIMFGDGTTQNTAPGTAGSSISATAAFLGTGLASNPLGINSSSVPVLSAGLVIDAVASGRVGFSTITTALDGKASSGTNADLRVLAGAGGSVTISTSLIVTSSLTVQGILASTAINRTYYANMYATGGDGSAADPWTGWEPSINILPSSSSIHFPNGDYNVSTPIIAGWAWTITGDGVENTRLHLTNVTANSTSTAIIQTSTNPYTSGYAYQVTIQDLYFDGNGKTYGSGIWGSFWLLHLYRSKFYGFGEYGVYIATATGMSQAFENYIVDVVSQSNSLDGVFIDQIGDGEILRLISRNNTKAGLHVFNAGAWKINESHFYNNNKGIFLKDCSRAFVNQSDIESNYGLGIHINGSGGNTIYGNNFWKNSFENGGSTSTILMEFTIQNSVVANNFYDYGVSSSPKFHVEEGRTTYENSIMANAWKGWTLAPVSINSGQDGPVSLVTGNYESGVGFSSATASYMAVTGSTGAVSFRVNSGSVTFAGAVFVGVSVTTQTAGGAGASVTATCDAGTFAIGGGCDCSLAVAPTGEISTPNCTTKGCVPTGWTCQQPGGTGGQCAARVICSRLQ